VLCSLSRHVRRKPSADLEDPDVTIIANVLGPRTALGLSRKTWKQQRIEKAAKPLRISTGSLLRPGARTALKTHKKQFYLLTRRYL
jgi:hypothetical protein